MEPPKTGQEYLDAVFSGSEDELHNTYLELVESYGEPAKYNIFSGEVIGILGSERVAILTKLHEQALVQWVQLRTISHHPFLAAYRALTMAGRRPTYGEIYNLYVEYLAFGYPGNESFPFNNLSTEALEREVWLLENPSTRREEGGIRSIPIPVVVSAFGQETSGLRIILPTFSTSREMSSVSPRQEETRSREQLIQVLVSERYTFSSGMRYIAAQDTLRIYDKTFVYLWAAMHDITTDSPDKVDAIYLAWLWPGWLDKPTGYNPSTVRVLSFAVALYTGGQEVYIPGMGHTRAYSGPRIRTEEKLLAVLRSGYYVNVEQVDITAVIGLEQGEEEEHGLSEEEEYVYSTIEHEISLSVYGTPPLLDLSDLVKVRYGEEDDIFDLLHFPPGYTKHLLDEDRYYVLTRGYTKHAPSLKTVEEEVQKLQVLSDEELAYLLLVYNAAYLEDLAMIQRIPDLDTFVQTLMQITDVTSLATVSGMIIPPECVLFSAPVIIHSEDTSQNTITGWKEMPGIPQLYFLNNIRSYLRIVHRDREIIPLSLVNPSLEKYTDKEIMEAVQVYVPYTSREHLIDLITILAINPSISPIPQLPPPSIPQLPTPGIPLGSSPLANLTSSLPPAPETIVPLPHVQLPMQAGLSTIGPTGSTGIVIPPILIPRIENIFVPLSNNVGGVFRRSGTRSPECPGQIASGTIIEYKCHSVDDIIRGISVSSYQSTHTVNTISSSVGTMQDLLILSYRFPQLANIRSDIVTKFAQLNRRHMEELHHTNLVSIYECYINLLDDMIELGQEIVRIFSQQSTEEITGVNSGQSTEEIPAGRVKVTTKFAKYYHRVITAIPPEVPVMKYNQSYIPEWLTIKYLLMFMGEGVINSYIGKILVSTGVYYGREVPGRQVHFDITRYTVK